MPRYLAIDWDSREVRCVLATGRGGRLHLVAAGAAPIASLDEEADVAVAISRGIGQVLDGHRPGRATTLVGVDRASVELMQFTLPPASDAELPELVRNQALRESSQVAEDSRLDFVAEPFSPGEPRSVTAVAMSAESLERITAQCKAAGVSADRLVLRPYSAASLFVRAVANPPRVSLLVNLFAEEADLTVVFNGKVAFWRTVRLPTDSVDETLTKRLLTEIGRTTLVVQSQPLGGTVEHVYLLGSFDEHDALVEQALAELSLPASVLEPFLAAGLDDSLLPANPGRYAALLGMLLDEANGDAHAIDFLHPRQQPKPVGRRRPAAIAGAFVAALVLAAGYYTWSALAEVDAQNQELTQRLKELDALNKRAAEQQKIVAAVRDWTGGEVVWLDELRDLSAKLPSSRDVVLLRMSLARARAGGGTIDLEGLVRDPAIVGKLEHNLGDSFHEVRSKRVQERSQANGYQWHFETSLSAAHRDKGQYLAPASATANDKAKRPPEIKSRKSTAPASNRS